MNRDKKRAPVHGGTLPKNTGRDSRRTRVRLAAIGLTALGGLALAGCSTAASTSSSSGTSSAKASSTKKVPLVIYAAEGYDMAEGKAFQQATGIPTTVDDNSTGPLITKIEAEKNNPQWDVFWTDGAVQYAEFDTQGLLVKGFEPSADYNSLGTSLLPKDKSYIPTGVTMAAALVYDTKTVTTPPTSWSQLLSSKWKGKVGMNDPAVSGPTYPYVAGQMASLGGVKQGEAFFSKLKANGLHIYQTNTNTLQALETGQIQLATIQNSAGLGAATSNKNLRVVYLKPETVLPSVIGIDAHVSAQARKEAEQFANFVMSPAGQKVMKSGDPTGDSLFFPLVKGEKPLPAVGASLTSIPTQNINPYVWGPRENSINTWFTNNIVR